MKYIDWDGKDIKITQPAMLTVKLDGICCIIDRERGYCVSRAGKRLRHTDLIYEYFKDTKHEAGEIYLGSFKDTISAVRSIEGDEIPLNCFFTHTPSTLLHSQLLIRYIMVDTIVPATHLNELLTTLVQQGYEGMVYHEETRRVKIKPKVTYDVKITGVLSGKGKYIHKLGAFATDMGNVGTGFTDGERERYYNDELMGKMIEVAAMELTESGKFRHPRFIRMRPDKDT